MSKSELFHDLFLSDSYIILLVTIPVLLIRLVIFMGFGSNIRNIPKTHNGEATIINAVVICFVWWMILVGVLSIPTTHT